MFFRFVIGFVVFSVWADFSDANRAGRWFAKARAAYLVTTNQ